MLTNEVKKEIIEQYAVHEGDTGSPGVQIAILSENRSSDRTSEDAQERPSFPPRTAENGWPA